MSKKNKQHKSEHINLPQGWLLMGKEDYTVEDIKNVVDSNSNDIEIWKEAGILEIGIDEKNSMDIESMEMKFDDEYTESFVREHAVKCLFYLSFRPEIYEECKKLMKKLVTELDCMIVADTEDFMPQI